MNMIKAVLFDIDGVLVDSREAGFHFCSAILQHMGYPKPTRKEHGQAFHLPLGPAIKKMAKVEHLTEKFGTVYDIAAKVPYRLDLLTEPPHAKKTIELLSQAYKLGIITSRNKEGLSKRYFPLSDNERYFSVTVTVEDVTHHKPHPEPLLLAAKRLGLKPEECVYIGDSHSDIEAGKVAGMKTILYGSRKNKDADARTASFKMLPRLIAGL